MIVFSLSSQSYGLCSPVVAYVGLVISFFCLLTVEALKNVREKIAWCRSSTPSTVMVCIRIQKRDFAPAAGSAAGRLLSNT